MSNKKDDLDEIFGELKDVIGDIDKIPEKTVEKARQVAPGAFPTEMNCSQVFDQLLKCYSIGGQMRYYYRYGEMSYCQDKQKKLKFCLKTKMLSEEDKKQNISKWYMQQLAEQKLKKQTSEQIWNARTEPVRRPFREDSEKYFDQANN